MKKSEALANAMATLNYCLTYYSEEIVSFTCYSISYDVTLQLEHSHYSSERELERIKNVLLCGAKYRVIEPKNADYDIITMNWYFD